MFINFQSARLYDINECNNGVSRIEEVMKQDLQMSDLSIYDVYSHHFWTHISQLENTEQLRDFLNICHGSQLVQCLQQGEADVAREFPWLSIRTRGCIAECTQQVQLSWSELQENWDIADHYERYGTLKGLAVGALSEETALGAAIGTAILPGIGSIIGSAIGGMIAGNKLDKQAQQNLEILYAKFDQMLQVFENLYNTKVVPSINHDIDQLSTGDHDSDTPLSWGDVLIIIFMLLGAAAIVKVVWDLF